MPAPGPAGGSQAVQQAKNSTSVSAGDQPVPEHAEPLSPTADRTDRVAPVY